MTADQLLSVFSALVLLAGIGVGYAIGSWGGAARRPVRARPRHDLRTGRRPVTRR